ncbi:hypothetical protein BVRB_032490, partial [Beta vulgaris subsp. vulgaris]
MSASDDDSDERSLSSASEEQGQSPVAKRARIDDEHEENDVRQEASALPLSAQRLPAASRYEKSFSHVDVVTKALFTQNDFLVTADKLGQI